MCADSELPRVDEPSNVTNLCDTLASVRPISTRPPVPWGQELSPANSAKNDQSSTESVSAGMQDVIPSSEREFLFRRAHMQCRSPRQEHGRPVCGHAQAKHRRPTYSRAESAPVRRTPQGPCWIVSDLRFEFSPDSIRVPLSAPTSLTASTSSNLSHWTRGRFLPMD